MELFETTPPGRLLWRFAWPSILSLLANGLYNVVDRAFVGQLVGTDALTAVSVVFPLSIAILAGGLLVGQGVAAQMSLSLGAKNQPEAEGALGLGVSLSVVTSILLAVLLVPSAEPLLRLMGTPESVVKPSLEFFGITLIGMPFLVLSMGVGIPIRSQGRAKTALVTGLVGIVANVVFCWLFIAVFGWGLNGSAWASTAAQALGALVSVGFYFTPLKRVALRLSALWPGRTLAGKVLGLGIPSMAGNLIGLVLMVILNIQVQAYGAGKALAVVGVINTLGNLVFLPAWGLMNGAGPIFGYNAGARRTGGNRRMFWVVTALLTAYFSAWTLVLELWPRALLGIFSHDADLVNFGQRPIQVFMAMLGFAAFQVVGPGYFQAVGHGGVATAINLIRPAALAVLVVVLPMVWGFDGFLASGPVADGLTLAVTTAFVLRERPLVTASFGGTPRSR